MNTKQLSRTLGTIGELTDAELHGVSGGKSRSQEAFDILIDHGDELTFKEQVACAYVWIFGCVPGPDGQGDGRPHGSIPPL